MTLEVGKVTKVQVLDHNAQQELRLKSTKDLATDRLSAEKPRKLDAHYVWPLEVVHAMCGEELEIQLLMVPEETGGRGGGAFDVYRVCEESGSTGYRVVVGR